MNVVKVFKKVGNRFVRKNSSKRTKFAEGSYEELERKLLGTSWKTKSSDLTEFSFHVGIYDHAQSHVCHNRFIIVEIRSTGKCASIIYSSKKNYPFDGFPPSGIIWNIISCMISFIKDGKCHTCSSSSPP